MLLEVKVFGSAEWFDEVYPKFETMGFVEQKDLGWSDPETDGEYMGYYFDYNENEGMHFDDFVGFIKEMEEIINKGEAPFIKINIVKSRKQDSS